MCRAPDRDGRPSQPSTGSETDPLVEKLADHVHDPWTGWMQHLFRRCTTNPCTGEEVVPVDAVCRWRRQMDTPYSALSEAEKESDRIEARRILVVLGMRSAPEDEVGP